MAWSTILSEQVKRPWGRGWIQGYWPELQFNDSCTEVNFYPANYGITQSVKVENEMYIKITSTCFELDYLKHIFPKVIIPTL